jgi:DNA-binding XRE family transcriptional regulator
LLHQATKEGDSLSNAIPRKKLIKARKEKGLSQAQVGFMLGVSRSFYNQIEKGHRNPRYETTKKLCAFFDLDINSLD